MKEVFEELKPSYEPDLIFTHNRDDLHQDHRLACELTWNTYRNHLVLEYEIPKVDGDLVRPNLYLQLHETTAEEKIELLLEHFPSQRLKHWFDAETFRGLMRIRGLECVAQERYAEAFTARKLQLVPAPASQPLPFVALASAPVAPDRRPALDVELSNHLGQVVSD